MKGTIRRFTHRLQIRMCICERRSESSLFGPENKLASYGRIWLKVSFFPRLIKYFYSSRTVSSELTTLMCSTERERPQTDQLPWKYSLSFFWLTFILKIQRSTFKTGSAVACISTQADLSFGYKAKD